MTNKFLITKKGKEILEQEIEKIKNDFLELLKTKRDAYYNQGDTWHDNSAFEEISREEVRLGKMIEHLCSMLVDSELVENSTNKDIVGIGSTITISDKSKTQLKFLVSGFREGDMSHSPKKLEYLSPLVNGFFGKKIGHKEKVKFKNTDVEFELISIE